MMNKEQAIAYGKRIGVKFYVMNSNGGLLGGYTTREAAEEARQRFQREYNHNPWNKGMTVRIEEKC